MTRRKFKCGYCGAIAKYTELPPVKGEDVNFATIKHGPGCPLHPSNPTSGKTIIRIENA